MTVIGYNNLIMKRFLFLISFFLTLSFTWLQDAYCQVAEAINNPWIIIDGPGIGIQLEGDSDILITTISSSINMVAMADGMINEPSDSCPGDKQYYSGTLYGQPSPGRCSWGHVIRYKDASDELKTITDIIKREESVHFYLSESKDRGALELDKQYLEYIFSQIKNLKILLNKNDKVTSKTTRNLFRKLDSINNLDNEVLKSFKKFITQVESKGENIQLTDQSPIRKKLDHDLSLAYDIKVKIVKEIVSIDGLLK